MKENDLLAYYTACARLLEDAVGELKVQIQSASFSGKEEEIGFFRDQAPELYSKLFLFKKLVRLECCRHYMNEDTFKELLQWQFSECTGFFIRRADFCQYYYDDKVYWDEYLYLRKGYGEWSRDEVGAYIDEDFTIGAYWASWMLAYGLLKTWVERTLL